MTMTEERRRGSPHFVVYGNNALAYHLVEQLADHGQVVVIIPPSRPDYGPRISSISSRVEVIPAPVLDEDVLSKARVTQAGAVALVGQGDADNIRDALKINKLNSDARLVIRFFDMNLGKRIHNRFPNWSVLSDADTVGPSFAAVASDDRALPPVELLDVDRPVKTLYKARRNKVRADRLVCVLARERTPGNLELLPSGCAEDGDPVLALGKAAVFRRGYGQLGHLWWRIRARLNRKLMWAILALVLLLGLGTAAFTLSGFPWSAALYNTVLDVVGAAQPDPTLSKWGKIIQAVVTLIGISAIIPLITAAVITEAVRSRYPTLAGLRRIKDHVVLVGLGNVGIRVLEKLREQNVRVVCVDNDENARGVPHARQNRVPIVFGDVRRLNTLHNACVAKCRALVVVTNDDATNLTAALHGREINKDLHVALRLIDDDLAREAKLLGISDTSSVPYVAALAFAAKMLRRNVLGTIPIGREVLLIAEVPIRAGSALAGKTSDEVNKTHEVRLIAIRHHPENRLELLMAPDGRGSAGAPPPPMDPLVADDRLIVVATRRGLGQILNDSSATLSIST